MSNPAADFPAAAHAATDVSVFAASNLGGTNPTHTELEGKQEAEITAITKRLLGAFVNVKEYGAAGDGVTDDATAIQTALDAVLSAGGGVVFIPTGEYYLGSGLVHTGAAEAHIIGAGRSATILQYQGSSVALTIGNGTDYLRWGSVQSLQIEAHANAAVTGIALNHVHVGFLRDLLIEGVSDPVGSVGINATDAWQNYFRELVVASFKDGVYLDHYCHDFELQNVSIGVSGTCLTITDSGQVRVWGGQYSDAAVGIKLISETSICRGFWLGNTHFEGNALDLALGRTADGSTRQATGPVVVGCPLPSGAVIDWAINATLIGVEVGTGSNTPSLTIASNAEDTKILGLGLQSGATLSDAGQDTVYLADDGFVCRSTSKGFTHNPSSASGNAFYCIVGSEANPRYVTRYDGLISWGAGGASAGDTNLYRSAANILKTDDKLVTVVGLGVGNSAAGSTPGTCVKKMEVFDASGTSLGFVPIYDGIA